MSNNPFIKKRQKERQKQSFLTAKLILRLVVASGLMWLGFVYFVGDPSEGLCAAGRCEAEFTLGTYLFAGLIMLSVVVALGAVTGALIGYLRGGQSSGTLSTFLDTAEDTDAPTDDTK